MLNRSIILISWIFIQTFPTPAFSQMADGKKLFGVNCSVCHTLGAGKLIGPDLAGILERRDRNWIVRFIRSSQTMITNGDKQAVAVFEDYDKMIMPDQTTLSDTEIEAILAYIGDPGSYSDIAADFEPDSEPLVNIPGQRNQENEMNPEDINHGRDLFNGRIQMHSGGPACISCHNVSEGDGNTGGQLAPDLTNVYSRIDESMIMELATNPKYPSMQKVYLDKPITPEEAASLASYLRYAGTGSAYQQERNRRAADFLKRINRSGQQ
jgi:mono/diheme cytochrome c family protein